MKEGMTFDIVRLVINNEVSVYDALADWGIISRSLKDIDMGIFCPFHNDKNHKSGYVYSESNSLYCFTEHKRYRPFDVYYKGIGLSIIDIYSKYEYLFENLDVAKLVDKYDFSSTSTFMEELVSLPTGEGFWVGLDNLLFTLEKKARWEDNVNEGRQE